MPTRSIFVLALVLFTTSVAPAYVTYSGPLLHEFGIMGEYPASTMDPNSGRYIIVRHGKDNEYRDEYTIYADIFDPNQGTILRMLEVEAQHDIHCYSPDVAANIQGKVAVVWASDDTDDLGICGRILDNNGNFLTGIFPVNIVTTGCQHQPKVALNDQGVMAIVWTSGAQDGPIYSTRIAARLFDTSATPLTPELDIVTTPDCSHPAIAMDNTHGFAVTWLYEPSGLDQHQIALRMFDPNGTACGPVKVVAPDTHVASPPDIDMAADGSFIVTWHGAPVTPIDSDIYAQHFDPNGDPQAPPFVVNQFTTGKQEHPSVAISDANNVVFAWQSENADDYENGICGRRYDPNGDPATDEFPINTFRYGNQHHPQVVFKQDDIFLTTWQSDATVCDRYGDEVFCEEESTTTSQFGHKPAPSCSCVDVDLSRNGHVDLNDLTYFSMIWLEWGYYGGYNDGYVDMTDFSFMTKHWNVCCKTTDPAILEVYRADCQRVLRFVNIMIVLYANDYRGSFPPDLETLLLHEDPTLREHWFPGEMLTCPADCPDTDGISYIYRADDLIESDPSYMVVMYDKYENHDGEFRNVLFVGGSIQTMTEEEFQAAIEVDNEYRRNSSRLEEKPIPWGGD